MGDAQAKPILHNFQYGETAIRIPCGKGKRMKLATVTATAFYALISAAAPCQSANLAGVTLGAEVSTIEKLETAPEFTDIAKNESSGRWQKQYRKFQAGAYVGVLTKDNIITHIELAAMPTTHVPTGIKDFVLNQTTLAHVYGTLGSKGFIHNSVPFVNAPDALILNASYRVAGEPNAVLWFVAMAPQTDRVLDPKSPEAAEAAIVVSVALSDKSYLDVTLGEAKTFSEGAKEVKLR
jgi:hypothetical protein